MLNLQEIQANISKKIPAFSKMISRTILFLAFCVLEIILIMNLFTSARQIATYKAEEFWPSSFDPVARFVLSTDWSKRKVTLDASMSKAYRDKIEKYVWRIDDGTGFVGKNKITHQFENPGYYTISLSIIDSTGQSDVAECRILFATKEVEQIETQKSTDANASENAKTVSMYEWAPKGTFFNYSKLKYGLNNDNAATLLSNYVEDNCGLSDQGYNVSNMSSNLSNRNAEMARAIVYTFAYTFSAIILFAVYLMLTRKLNKKQI